MHSKDNRLRLFYVELLSCICLLCVAASPPCSHAGAASASLRSEYVRVGLYDVFCPYFVDTLGKVKKAQNIAAKEGCKPSNKKSLFEYLAWVISSTLFREYTWMGVWHVHPCTCPFLPSWWIFHVLSSAGVSVDALLNRTLFPILLR